LLNVEIAAYKFFANHLPQLVYYFVTLTSYQKSHLSKGALQLLSLLNFPSDVGLAIFKPIY